MGQTLDCFHKGIEFSQSHRPEEVIPDSYDKCEPRSSKCLNLFSICFSKPYKLLSSAIGRRQVCKTLNFKGTDVTGRSLWYAILLLEDVKLANTCFHHNICLTYQTFVTNLHLLRVELRCTKNYSVWQGLKKSHVGTTSFDDVEMIDLTNVAAENDNNVQQTSDNTNFPKSRLRQINMASFQVF